MDTLGGRGAGRRRKNSGYPALAFTNASKPATIAESKILSLGSRSVKRRPAIGDKSCQLLYRTFQFIPMPTTSRFIATAEGETYERLDGFGFAQSRSFVPGKY